MTVCDLATRARCRRSVENRGGAQAPPFDVSLLLSASNRFDAGLLPLGMTALPALDPGAAAHGSLTITLPLAETLAQPLLDAQPIFLGLGIGSAMPASPEQGNDWAAL